MLAHNAQRSLDVAAAKTLARIRTDQRKVNGRLRPLLEHIENHLFDPGLDVNQLKRRCGVRDNSIPIQFHAKLGLPPHAYIEDCRLDTACHLLRDTELKIWQIATMLGYSSIQVFSRAFSRWAKSRPSAYRLSARREAATGGAQQGVVVDKSMPISVATPGQAVSHLKLALDGELDAKQADRLIRRLLNLYPATGLLLERAAAEPRIAAEAPVLTFRARANGSNGTNGPRPTLADEPIRTMPLPPPPGPDYRRLLTLEEIEGARAAALWDQIRDLPQDEMRTAIQQSGQWETGALFEVIRQGGLKQGRGDRKRGIEISELLLQVPDDVGHHKSQSRECLRKASAWTWIGNARRLNWDFAGAEEAFDVAGTFLSEETDAPSHKGDLALVRSNLRMFQRSYPEALDLAAEARDFYRLAERPEQSARALAQRASVLKELGRIQESIEDAKEALSAFVQANNTHMTLVSYSILGRCYADDRQHEEALAILSKAREAAKGYSDTEYLLKFAWLEADVVMQAGEVRRGELLYADVIEAFIQNGRPGDAASAALELACHQWTNGNDAAVAKLLQNVLPAFERLQMKQDAIAALKLLEQTASRAALSKAIFDSVRKEIER